MLLQIIGERETQSGKSMLSNELLANLIRFYGPQDVMSEHLENSVSEFIQQQDQLREQMHTVSSTHQHNPATTKPHPG